MSATPIPRILVVEDDPVSRAFLAAVAANLPATVEQAASIAEARALAFDIAFDLFLIDANLPDGHGRELLHALRRHATAPALAHTAATDRALLDGLVDVGFAEVLVKPLSASQLLHAISRALRRALPPAPATHACCGKLPVRDEDAALAAVNGPPTHALRLWLLFLAELPSQRDAVLLAASMGDTATLHAQLHRLQASCGFVGAARLAAAVRALRAAPYAMDALEAFVHAAEDTLASAPTDASG
jgi:CheY-like chemotaxis protein/HPt (histidine-containing phosphotransfer) domain-containing protein